MASAIGKTQCTACGKGNAILKCGGCAQDFCYNHFGDHRQQLHARFDEIEVARDEFRQTLSEQITEIQKHPLMQQIDQWEKDSIDKIRQTAEEARQILRQHTDKHLQLVEVMLNNLTDQLRQSRLGNDFVEADLQRWNKQLTELTMKLNHPVYSLQQDTKPLVNQIHVEIRAIGTSSGFEAGANLTWIRTGIVVAGGNGYGASLNQLSKPLGIFIDDNQTIYIADMANHRIVKWESNAESGRVAAGGNGNGNQTNQLNRPNDVILDKKTNSLIISDSGNRRIVRWSLQDNRNGQIIISNIDCCRLSLDHHGYLFVSNAENHVIERWRMEDRTVEVVAGGNEKGNHLDQLCEPTFITVDEDQTVYVSDWGNHRVMKWLKNAKQGIVVAGGQNRGNNLTQLSRPQGLSIDPNGSIYVADNSNNRVICWRKGSTQGAIIVGGNGIGEGLNQLNRPQGLSFDRQGNLYVVDQWNHRVLKFPILPHEKV